MTTDTKRLKARISITDVLVKVGARVAEVGLMDEEVKVYCPFCEDAASRRPAGRANELKGVYHCWFCGFGGDIISIAREHLFQEAKKDPTWGAYGVSFNDAVAWLLENFPEPEDEWPVADEGADAMWTT